MVTSVEGNVKGFRFIFGRVSEVSHSVAVHGRHSGNTDGFIASDRHVILIFRFINPADDGP